MSIKGRNIASIQEPQRNKLVLKDGANTGVTEGKIGNCENITITSVHPDNQDLQKQMKTKAWSVTVSDPARSTGKSAFSTKGDSGSLVVNTSSASVGQIHSGLDDGQGFVTTYMSPAISVIGTARALLPGCQVDLLTVPPSIPATTRLLDRCRRAFEGLI